MLGYLQIVIVGTNCRYDHRVIPSSVPFIVYLDYISYFIVVKRTFSRHSHSSFWVPRHELVQIIRDCPSIAVKWPFRKIIVPNIVTCILSICSCLLPSSCFQGMRSKIGAIVGKGIRAISILSSIVCSCVTIISSSNRYSSDEGYHQERCDHRKACCFSVVRLITSYDLLFFRG